MKKLAIVLMFITAPVLAQSNFNDNRYNGAGTQIFGNQGRLNQNFNQVNGYYYDKQSNTYYKGKNINRDAGSFSGNQGNLSYTYDRSQYAPRSLRVD